MKSCFHECGKVYRIGGDEFVVILTGQIQQLETLLREFDHCVVGWQGELIDSMTISYGYVCSFEQRWDSMADASKAADARMYEKKEQFYRENGVKRRGE